ncbi:hypothetical protein OnM2_105008 [Erysiphe neolycopersici]|uniref:Uncharacterized protein n=1 Tax=Erysiphe neolycopersici TaxID=212602 RepID=A0A420H7N0_9PEZI|nr:hypothetical protein OnM2_105008 [Erysiphe neolycopersici]
MFSLNVSNRRRLEFGVTDQNTYNRPYEPKFLCRTKTTAASINAKTKATIQAKIIAASKSIAKAQSNEASTIKSTPSNASINSSGNLKPPSKSSTVAKSKSQIKPSQPNSKILDEVRKVAEKNGKTTGSGGNKAPSKQTPKSNPSITSKPKAPVDSHINSKVTRPIAGSKIIEKFKNSSTEKRPPPLPQAPFKAQNSKAQPKLKTSIQEQSQVRATTYATKSKPLPPNYKSTKRKVTMAIVALPIVFVTSWVLFERLWLGKERKELVPPGMSKVKEKKEDIF